MELEVWLATKTGGLHLRDPSRESSRTMCNKYISYTWHMTEDQDWRLLDITNACGNCIAARNTRIDPPWN